MKNLLNIDDKVKIIMPNFTADGKEVTVESIQKMSGEIFYVGKYQEKFCKGYGNFDMAVQFKEGQYEVIENQATHISLIEEISIIKDKLKDFETEIENMRKELSKDKL